MRLLMSLLLLCVALPVRAATGLSTPVFTNFFQEHFIVAPNAPPTQIIKSRIFGPATNIFNLTTNIYNNSYFVESNVTQIIDDSTIIITNTTINITNVTFIVNGQTNDITQLWRTNAQGIYFPAITNTATIVVGQNAETWWSPTLADGFVSIHDASVGDSQFNSMAIAAIDNVLQENYGTFTSTLGSGAAPAGAMQLLAATNWQNPSAPFSKFSVALQPAYGEVLLDLMNNGVHEFAVSNQITSVQAIQLVPITNSTLALGANQINVQSNSFISLVPVDPDPSLSTISLSTGLRDGMLLLLKNVGVDLGFTLPNGSPLYDDPTKYVTLPGGTWVSTNYGDSMLLAGGLNGWTEIKRWGQNTNVITEQLWVNDGGVYKPNQLQSVLVATNISSLITLDAVGAFRTSVSYSNTIAPGTFQLSPNLIGFAELGSTTTTSSDTTLRLGLGDIGQHLWLVHNDTNSFQLLNGDSLYNDPTRFLYLSGGDWKPTVMGETLELVMTRQGWMEAERNNANTNIVTGDMLWELISGHMQTVPDTLDDWQFRYGGVPQLTISTNGGISVGTNSLTISGYSETGRRYLNLADISKGDPESWEVWTGSYMDGADTANGYSFFDIYGGTNTAHLILNSQGTSGAGGYISLGTTSIDEGETTFSMIVSNISVMGMRPTAIEGQAQAYYFDTLHPFTVSNIFAIKNAGTNQLSFGPDARITFGEGGTNVLYREPLVGTDLVYTNGYQYPNLKVYGSEGLPAYFGLTPGSYGTFAQATGPKGVALGWDTGLLAMGSSNVWGSTPFNLGTVTVPFADVNADGKIYVYGYNPHSGADYSRLAMLSTGTNTWDTHQLNSQSVGTAGTPRPIMFTNQPTVIIAGTTNFITFGSTNVAPVDAVTIFKWVSVSISGEATEYRVPLYK